MSDALRTLKIRTGTVRRLAKDVTFGRKESEEERERMRKLKENGGDEYEVRAQDKVIADADQMVPDYQKRLAVAVEELEELIVGPPLHPQPPFRDSSPPCKSLTGTRTQRTP